MNLSVITIHGVQIINECIFDRSTVIRRIVSVATLAGESMEMFIDNEAQKAYFEHCATCVRFK